MSKQIKLNLLEVTFSSAPPKELTAQEADAFCTSADSKTRAFGMTLKMGPNINDTQLWLAPEPISPKPPPVILVINDIDAAPVTEAKLYFRKNRTSKSTLDTTKYTLEPDAITWINAKHDEYARKQAARVNAKSNKDINAKDMEQKLADMQQQLSCLLYTSPSPRDATLSRMPSSA